MGSALSLLKYLVICGLLISSVQHRAHAAQSMLELLEIARRHDPDYNAAAAARDAGLQSRVAARAQLLPSVSMAYEAGNSSVARDYNNGAQPLDYDANSRTLIMRVSQPVFSLERWAAWKEENARAVLAELKFQEASIELALRLARSVFDNLLSTENLTLAQAQLRTLKSQRAEAEALRQAGVLTVTEVEDTRAKELSTQSAVLEAEFGVKMRRKELQRIVGSSEAPEISALAFDVPEIDLEQELDRWLTVVRKANPKIVSATMAVEAVTLTLEKAKAAHAPVVDLIASTSRTQNPNQYTTLEKSGGITLRLTVPIFEGGRTQASVERAVAVREQAKHELSAAEQDAEVKATEAYLGIANARAKIVALTQARTAAQTVLRGALAGRVAGLRTHTEVLNAQQQVYAVSRDLAKERYNMALAALQLKALAGQLDDSFLREVRVRVEKAEQMGTL